jgi:hypothetical protein
MADVPVLRPLCDVEIVLREGAPIPIGQSPWTSRRISDIAGGTFSGPRLEGTVEPSGADWSQSSATEEGDVLTALDVRSLWRTHDGAAIYVTYGGRFVIPAALRAAFADPARVDALDESTYYFRTNPVFETGAAAYAWLNRIVAIGVGKRTRRGVDYRIFEVG